jgi:hypothetical protein
MTSTKAGTALSRSASTVAVVVGVPILDFLQRHLAVQFGITGHENLAEAPLGVRPQDMDAENGGGGRAGRRRLGSIGIEFRRASGRDVGQAGVQVRIDDLLQVLADGADGTDGGEALLGIVAVQFQVLLHHRV